MGIYSAKIIGTGMYVPERIVTNKELEGYIDTSDEWIRKKTGIEERRVASIDELPSDLSAKSALMAINNAGLKAEDIDLIIVAISIVDTTTPAVSAIVQKKIGAKNAVVFDVHNACQGFLNSVIIAHNFIANGKYENVLVIGTSFLGTVLDTYDWRDRSKSVFFGDGSGAMVLTQCSIDEGIIEYDMGNDMEKSNILYFPFGGVHALKNPEFFSDTVLGEVMEGKEIWNFIVKNIPLSINRLMKNTVYKKRDISKCIFHQANLNLINELILKCDLTHAKTFTTIQNYGNTSEASVPITFHEALKNEFIEKKDLVLLCAFGSGLGYASILLKY